MYLAIQSGKYSGAVTLRTIQVTHYYVCFSSFYCFPIQCNGNHIFLSARWNMKYSVVIYHIAECPSCIENEPWGKRILNFPRNCSKFFSIAFFTEWHQSRLENRKQISHFICVNIWKLTIPHIWGKILPLLCARTAILWLQLYKCYKGIIKVIASWYKNRLFFMFGKQMLVIHILCQSTFRMWPWKKWLYYGGLNPFEIIFILNISVMLK